MSFAFSLAAFIMACSFSMEMPLPFDGCGLIVVSLLALSTGDLLLSAMVPGRRSG
jgi:hypothetical protein